MDEIGLTPITLHPTRPRGAHNLLSHLPLHSQQQNRAPGLLIPIGGIHMIQPRSLLSLSSLVSSPTTAASNPAETSWRLSDATRGRSSLLQRQDTLKERSPSSPASTVDPGASGPMSTTSQSDALSNKKRHGCFRVQTMSPRTETRPLEVNKDKLVTERCVYPETTQGQKKAPSSQTQL